MAVTITPDDVAALAPRLDPERVAAFIPGMLATAILAAPCLGKVAPDSDQAQAAKLIIVAAIARLVGAASNPPGVTQQTAGSFNASYSPIVGTFSDNELAKLKAICNPGGRAFALDTIPDGGFGGPDWWEMSRRETLPISDLEAPPADCLNCAL